MKNHKLLGLIFVLIVMISIILFHFGNDYYWHVKVGEYIVSNLKIPYTDCFSWFGYLHKLSWISHEWLFEVVIYLFSFLFKNYGAFIYCFIITLAISIILFCTNKDKFMKYQFYTLIWALLGMFIFGGKMLPRPHLISYLLFTITIYFAYDNYRNPLSKKIYFAPLISLLWSNLHGGSSNLSYLVYGLFFLVSVVSFSKFNISSRRLSKKQIQKYIYAILTSIICIVINPHGIVMLTYPYLNMTYTTMISCIDEWQALSLVSIDGIVYCLFLGFVLIKILVSKQNIKLIDLSLFIIFLILGVKSTRFMPYVYIVCSYFLFDYFSKSRFKIQLKTILIFLILGFSLFFAFSFELENDEKVSKEIIGYLKNNSTTLYNSYDLGGYLIFNDIKVFVDSRADMYYDTILCDVCDIEKGRDFSSLDKYNFDTFLVKNKSGIYNYLNTNNKYKLILYDSNTSLFTIKK